MSDFEIWKKEIHTCTDEILCIHNCLKGPAHSENENCLVPSQTIANGPTGPMFFCKLFPNGASHDTKIGCISLVWANKCKFSFVAMRRPFK